ncbi:hypothetical protein BBJ28_00022374 [Nothophytophthora sp. Chile5]|nr:hypothetical protein BBJ28_00022374 [Nothophytophthora sp. Chile5]
MLLAAQSSIAVVLVMVAAATTAIVPDASGNLRHVSRSLQTDDISTALLARVNQERVANDLPAVCWNSKLQAAAKRQSDDMAANDFLHHVGSDGSTVSSRITDAGYKWKAVAENVAAGQANVESVMDAWMNSTGHRMNILGNYTMLGAAYAYNPDSTFTHYWTEDFGTGDTEECDQTSGNRSL